MYCTEPRQVLKRLQFTTSLKQWRGTVGLLELHTAPKETKSSGVKTADLATQSVGPPLLMYLKGIFHIAMETEAYHQNERRIHASPEVLLKL
jgi:hypothetical protein